MDFRQLRKDRAEGWAEDNYSTMPAISAPAPSANDEVFFPWATDFRHETNYLETVLGSDLDTSSEAEDVKRVEQDEENLFLAATKRLAVKRM